MNQLILIGVMVIAAFLGASGQLMLQKVSGLPIKEMPFSFYAWGFASFYLVAVLINLWAYKMGGKASVLYPVIALSYVFTAVLAYKIFGDPINNWTAIGITAIVLGVGLIGWGSTYGA